ncbi:MAG TPA: cation:proton antiporter [Vicinamibacterales bacterium]
MRRGIALLLLIATSAFVTRYGSGTGPTLALAFGFALIAAALAGDVFERIRLPRLTGYLFFGMICGPYVANLISATMARELQLVNGLAISLIAFVAGLELNLAHLRDRFGQMLRLGGTLLLVMFAGIFAAVWLAWPWLPLLPEAADWTRVALSALVTTLFVSFSPTVTIAVIADSRARGPLTELVVAIVVLADLALIVSFTLAMQAARWALGGAGAEDISLLAQLSWEIFGSFAFGGALGSAFALYLRYVGREVTLVLLALCASASGFGSIMHFEPLLVALAAGLVVENIAAASGEALRDAVERGALPVLVVFFAAAGASLHLDALWQIGFVAIGVSLVRYAFIRLGMVAGLKVSGIDPDPGRHAWMGLVSQAGVTLGLTIVVANEFSDWGPRVQTLMVALIAIHEIVGPILFKRALVTAGEAGRL